jgi:uncharacterized protein (DUF433 family)
MQDCRYGRTRAGAGDVHRSRSGTGISTEALWEHERGGETISEIAADFDLGDEEVRWALAYETSARAA